MKGKNVNPIDVEKVVEYIRDNIENEISLDDIAKEMNYSKFYLSRTFKEHKGTSIKKYIEALKVERAVSKLMESEESVTDIALDLGHKSLGTFSNTFKKQTKVSPKKYKKDASLAYKFLKKMIQDRNILVHYNNFKKTGNTFSIRIKYPKGYRHKITCMGLFKEALPKGEPVIGVASADILEFTIDNVPNGKYYFFACEIMEDFSLSKSYVLDNNYRNGIFKPFIFEGKTHHSCEIMMRRKMIGDPPITINLPALLMRTFSNKIKYKIRKNFLTVYD